jgi:hypothetical protein
VIADIVNTRRYPLAAPQSLAWRNIVASARAQLLDQGCCVLRSFIDESAHQLMRNESLQIAPFAYYDVESVNVYNTDADPSLADGHPARISLRRENAFVARDCIPGRFIIQRLYCNERFRRFVAACFGLPRIYPLADPLAGLVLNVVRPGMQHPWHFDTNEFSVSLLTREADQGGVFEYCPDIRSPKHENFAAVGAVLQGRGEHRIRRLALRAGDLQLFKGRFSIHRVTPVAGSEARHTAIFAFSARPGVIGSVSRTRQLFGRVSVEHLEAEGRAVRGDLLLD